MLTTLLLVVVILGIAAIVLGLVPQTARHVGGVGPGIALLVVGMALLVILKVTGVPA